MDRAPVEYKKIWASVTHPRFVCGPISKVRFAKACAEFDRSNGKGYSAVNWYMERAINSCNMKEEIIVNKYPGKLIYFEDSLQGRDDAVTIAELDGTVIKKGRVNDI